MIDGKRILAVVPARGGSKGVPLKNIRPVNGAPLIALTARTLRECDFIDRAVVSTDHERIAEVSRGEGLDAPFMRPEYLSGDRIGDWDVLVHALKEMEMQDGRVYDVVLMLQPTSPLRTAGILREVATKLVREGFDSVWTVSPTHPRFHPRRLMRITDGQVAPFDAAQADVDNRPRPEPLYHRNGVAYAITRSCLLDQGGIMGNFAGAVVIEGATVNIDTLEDFAKLEGFLRR